MYIRATITVLLSLGMSAGAVYVYTLIDPRLEIIQLKNEEIMRLDNKIADLTEANAKVSEQVNSISTVVKSNEQDTGKINDEYKICLRTSKRLSNKVRSLNAEISVLQNKNKIMREYVSVNNDVTSLQEQIDILNKKKKKLTKQLGDKANTNLDIEGDVDPTAIDPEQANTPEVK
ncbi:MAG: hypothetical protein OEY29_10900 [Gammaproteobacteria bacterium]|nr:hypothetical protein [Gammaproteobacteria bacterium]